MTTATFLKLDKAKMTNAIANCRKLHPKTRRISRTQVEVIGSEGDAYTVTLAKSSTSDAVAYSCNCKAGKAGQYCKHGIAAYHTPGTILTESRAEQSAPTGAPHAAERDSAPPSFAAWNAMQSWGKLANRLRDEQPRGDVLAGAGLKWMVVSKEGVA